MTFEKAKERLRTILRRKTAAFGMEDSIQMARKIVFTISEECVYNDEEQVELIAQFDNRLKHKLYITISSEYSKHCFTLWWKQEGEVSFVRATGFSYAFNREECKWVIFISTDSERCLLESGFYLGNYCDYVAFIDKEWL